jgi:hypothetical protein
MVRGLFSQIDLHGHLLLQSQASSPLRESDRCYADLDGETLQCFPVVIRLPVALRVVHIPQDLREIVSLARCCTEPTASKDVCVESTHCRSGNGQRVYEATYRAEYLVTESLERGDGLVSI